MLSVLRPNRGWFFAGAGAVAAYVLDRVNAPTWLALLTLVLMVTSGVVWPWIERRPRRAVLFWCSAAVYAFVVGAKIPAVKLFDLGVYVEVIAATDQGSVVVVGLARVPDIPR